VWPQYILDSNAAVDKAKDAYTVNASWPQDAKDDAPTVQLNMEAAKKAAAVREHLALLTPL
jgi:hypothetical protein